MADYKGSSVDAKIEALARQARPHLRGRVVSQSADHVALQSGGSVVEVPRKAIVSQQESEGDMEIILAPDAEIIVSMAVSVQKGFLADDVFGILSPAVMADNCNCNCSGGNCNCNCSSDMRFEAVADQIQTAAGARRFRRFTGGGQGR
jgi:hypothetical protein